MCGILMGAAILGIIVAVMEQGEFPGWWNMILCVLASVGTEFFLDAALPDELVYILGTVLAGAVVAALALWGIVKMTFVRALIASGIYLAIKIAIAVVFVLVFPQ